MVWHPLAPARQGRSCPAQLKQVTRGSRGAEIRQIPIKSRPQWYQQNSPTVMLQPVIVKAPLCCAVMPRLEFSEMLLSITVTCVSKSETRTPVWPFLSILHFTKVACDPVCTSTPLRPLSCNERERYAVCHRETYATCIDVHN